MQLKINKKESGLVHLGLIIATVLLVAALIFAGWGVWKRSQNKKSEQSSDNTQQINEPQENAKTEKIFNCKDKFTLAYPESLQATLTDTGQCLVSNVDIEEMPPVGPLPPEQLGLFFGTGTTNFTSKDYLADYIERSQDDYPLELKTQQELKLNNNDTATLASIYGGHPHPHDFYLFIYVKDGMLVTSSYPVNSNYRETTLAILKSIQLNQ